MHTHQKNTDLCWLDKPYIPGCIFSHLTSMEYETVVSLDIGHGECVAYQYLKNHKGDWVAEPLSLNEAQDKSVLSYVAYIQQDGVEKAIIGSDAAESNSQLLTYYKTEPGDWAEFHLYDPHHTNGQILKDFITRMWADILRENEKLRDLDKNKVLITIGCPASPAWTSEENMHKYCKLAMEATGYSNVIIIPESTAAIMSAIYSKLGNTIRLEEGIAVYDLGSSTIDFTFILMGKVIITRSLRLGGSNIDLALLEMVSRKNSNQKKLDENLKHTLHKTEALLPKERDKACAQLRTSKERFFRNGENALEEKPLPLKEDFRISIDPEWIRSTGLSDPDAISVELWRNLTKTSLKGRVTSIAKENEYLGQIADCVAQVLKSGNAKDLYILFQQDLSYVLDKNLMQDALTLIHWDQLDKPYTGLSWYEAVKTFFNETKALIEMSGWNCGAVVLTGGTSKVSCVRQIADACYGADCVYNEPDTSVSVARGMCHAVGQEVHAGRKLEASRAFLKSKLKTHYETLCNHIANDILFMPFWQACAKATGELNDGNSHTNQELEQAIEKFTTKDPDFLKEIQSALREKLPTYIQECNGGCFHPIDTEQYRKCEGCTRCNSISEIIRQEANSISKSVYHVSIDKLPKVPDNLRDIASGAMDADVLSNMISALKIGKKLQNMSIDFIYDTSGLDSPLAKVGEKISKMKEKLKVFLSGGNRTLTADFCKCMAMAFENPDQTTLNNQKGSWAWISLCTNLKFSPEFKKAFESLIDQQLEIALGIVLFQIFQEANMI